ncbi:MAG: CHAT domain-containing protein [Elainellaceae cyanobacterium]
MTIGHATMHPRLYRYRLIAYLLGIVTVLSLPLKAEADVRPAGDGTGTRVTQDGDRFTIDGGTLSGDGRNLFHSLEEFGLSADEIATFMSEPEIQNILSRVVGGEASFIDGLIEVAGGDSNLFLINPAGVIFGSNARLDVSGDFTATSATGIGFADGWFDAFGDGASYSDLVGDPTGFRFATASPGAIANAGTLTVDAGHSLTLLGGTVVNTGTLAAPGGSITIAAVPGENLVRISHEGMVLNLEVESLANNPSAAGAALPFTPLSLPDMLTGSNAENATGITVNDNGTVSLSGSGVSIPTEAGTAIASGRITVRSEESSNSLPQIAVVGDRVAVLNGRLNASSADSGGLIRVGGNFQGNGTLGEGTIPNSEFTVVDESSRLRANGLGAIAEGGEVIIWSDGTTQFAGRATASAGSNGGNGGLIEVSGRENLTFTGLARAAAPNGEEGTILLDPTTITIVAAEGNAVPNLLFGDAPEEAFVEAGAINASVGNVILQANQDIFVNAAINSNSVDTLTLQAGRNITINDNITLNGGSFLARINDQGADPETRGFGLAAFRTDDVTITTINGDIVVEVGTFGGVQDGQVIVDNSTLSAQNGNISLTGIANDVSDGFLPSTNGVLIEGSIVEGSDISITGTVAGAAYYYGEGYGYYSNPTAGVRVEDSEIYSEGGTLQIEGTQQQGTTVDFDGDPIPVNEGVGVLVVDSEISNIGNGDIEIIGNSNVNLFGEFGNHGVQITGQVFEGEGFSSEISVANGTLRISGTAQTDAPENYGVLVAGSFLDAGDNGEIEVRGEAVGSPGILVAGSQINEGADSRRIALTADEIDLIDDSVIEGGGTLVLQPLTPDADIQVGGVVDGDDVPDDDRLTLNTDDLGAIANGFEQVIIGRANGSGQITVDDADGNIVFQDPTLLRSPTGAGSIDTTGGTIVATDEASLTLLANQNITTGDISAEGGEISATSLSGSIDTTNGALSTDAVAGGGEITLDAGLDVTTGDVTASAASDGSLADPVDGGTVNITAGRDVRIEGVLEANSVADELSLLNAGAGGEINVEAGNDIIVDGIVSASSSSTNGNAGDGGLVELNAANTTQINAAVSAESSAVDGTAASGGTIRANSGAGDLVVAAPLSVSSSTETGNASSGGQIELNATGAVQIDAPLEADSATVNGNASTGGDIRATAGTDVIVNQGISASSRSETGNSGNGGRIELIGEENIQIQAAVAAESQADSGNSGNGGSLRAEAENNLVVGVGLPGRSPYRLSTSTGAATGSAGNAGPIELSAGNNLQIQAAVEAESFGGNNSGNGGFIQAEAGNNLSSSTSISSATVADTGDSGNGGRIELRAGRNLQLEAGANSSSRAEGVAGSGGTIRLAAERNIDVTSTLDSSTDSDSGTSGNGGRIRITANNGDINLENFDSSANAGSVGGGVRVNSRNGSLTINADVLNDGVGDRTGGRISLRGETGVTLNLTPLTLSDGSSLTDPTLSTSGRRFSISSLRGLNINGLGDVPVRIATLGGNLRMRGQSFIEVDNVILDSSNSSGAGGTIRLLSPEGPITVGDLDSSGEVGGDVIVRSGVAITAGEINSSGSLGDGGNVLLDPPGDIEVAFINAQGGAEGVGGTVDITTGSFFRAREVFLDRNRQEASISTIGGAGGGDITIRHGGNGETPFDVGDGSVNGTAGAITSGEFSIEPFESFPFTYILGNISIITAGSPVEPPPELPQVEPTPEIDTDINNPPEDSGIDINIDTPLVTLVPTTYSYEALETATTDEFTEYWGLPDPPVPITIDEAQDGLRAIERDTGIKPAILYAFFVPSPVSLEGIEPIAPDTSSSQTQPLQQVSVIPGDLGAAPEYLIASVPPDEAAPVADVWIPLLGDGTTNLEQIDTLVAQAFLAREPESTDELELIMVTSDRVVRRRLSTATRAQVQGEADRLRTQITSPIRSNRYLPSSQRLYNWLVAPLEEELELQEVNNIAFVMDRGLRSLPVAALHDGEEFIIQNYSVGLMPTLSLTDTRYADIRAMDVLAMGAAEFSDLPPLPAVPVELAAITEDVWQGVAFVDDGFSVPNLVGQRRDRPYGIIHLATHGEFQPGDPANSYIQFGQQRLSLTQLRDLSLNDPPVELMVLSACRTALGDEEAELGFAGLAVQAGVKSALASLWYVSDTGTLAIMTQFYQEMQDAPIKAEALRQAQLDLLNGENRWIDSVQSDAATSGVDLAEIFSNVSPEELTHPYYWSAFTMIGSPW